MWSATGELRRGEHVDEVSIHAPHVERDIGVGVFGLELGLFQSTRPMWSATV